MRVDQLLVDAGLAASRSQAQRLIAAGAQWRLGADAPWQTIKKKSEELPTQAELRLLDASEAEYVSRGGLKLAGALTAAQVTVAGKYCLDVGQSTGGFSDCLLRRGAAYVVGVDVGHGQLHPSLLGHERLSVLEGVNARSLNMAQLIAMDTGAAKADLTPENQEKAYKNGFDLIVGDLSFISLSLVLPALRPLLAARGEFLLLVKPQFELQPSDIAKGGLVKDPSKYALVQKKIRAICADLDLQVLHWLDSPIAGGDGNREFFLHAQPQARVQAD